MPGVSDSVSDLFEKKLKRIDRFDIRRIDSVEI